jgi:SAM-dependent methyltransferase
LPDLAAWYRRQQFNPRGLGILANPFFLARRALWREMAANAPALSGRLLDVGCGRKPYRELFSVTHYTGLEIDSASARARGVADHFYDGGRFPFEDASFESVLCNQVLEHVFNPEQFVGEISRVLAPNGRLLLTVPFVWDEHEQPHDFARYTSFGLAHLLGQGGFRIMRTGKTLADASVLAQLTNAYLFKRTRMRSRLASAMAASALTTPVSLLGMLAGVLLPSNPDLFLDSVVLAEKVQ